MNEIEQVAMTPDEFSIETRRLDDLQSTFVRNVQHELRTPLAVIMGYANLLRDGELGDLAPEQQDAIYVIADRAWELRTLVERISTLLAVEARETVAQPLDLNEMVYTIAKSWREKADQTNLTLELNLAPTLPELAGDSQHLRHAIACLGENALKFTPAGGRITVHTEAKEDWIYLTITDTGIGIAEDKLTHIFNAFYQIDGSPSRRYGGLGLGLTVSKAVIEAHGGQIMVESELHQGSTFTVKLPLKSGITKMVLPSIKEEVLPRRILIVDDEEYVAAMLREGLEKLPNCEIATATCGELALQLFEEKPFDLLITDYKMPGVDGITLAGRIQQLYPHTAIIMLTAYSSDALHVQAADVSIQRVLDKPVKLAEIRRVASEALTNKKK
jgi:two-component system sensor histidine kinase/response regulator